MSLAHVLLTSLLEKPSTGFDLARRFDRSMGFFWNATHQQIYRELNGMLKKGWISTLEEQLPIAVKKLIKLNNLEEYNLLHGLNNKANLLNFVMTSWLD
jgi:DNA-binding PadR family transcriptional regulator